MNDEQGIPGSDSELSRRDEKYWPQQTCPLSFLVRVFNKDFSPSRFIWVHNQFDNVNVFITVCLSAAVTFMTLMTTAKQS